MNCLRVARALQAYVDGESDEVTARRVAAHLEDCRRCGLEAETYLQIKGALARERAPDPETVRRLRAFGASLADAGSADPGFQEGGGDGAPPLGA